jgi:hypothetical protein
MIKTNHIASELVTKGLISSYPIMQGILSHLEYEIITKHKRKHGGISYVDLKGDIKKHKDDITAINVFVDWWKKREKKPGITVEMIENRIHAELLNDFGKELENVKININIIDEKNDIE